MNIKIVSTYKWQYVLYEHALLGHYLLGSDVFLMC